MLEENWLYEGTPDFEYKKYRLLAFLKRIDTAFDSRKLYPSLSQLLQQYAYLTAVKKEKMRMQEAFPKSLKGFNKDQFDLEYESLHEDSEIVELIARLIDFSVPKIKNSILLGQEIYDDVEQSINVQSIGISPLYAKEGLVFVKPSEARLVHLFQYKMEHVIRAGEYFRGIHLKLVETIIKSIGETFEGVKQRLTKKLKLDIIPATFLLEYDRVFPFKETMIPVAKRTLLLHFADIEKTKL